MVTFFFLFWGEEHWCGSIARQNKETPTVTTNYLFVGSGLENLNTASPAFHLCAKKHENVVHNRVPSL